MSLNIYLDDCVTGKLIGEFLTQAGHTIIRPRDAGLSGKPDSLHFQYAASHSLTILTKNPDHFKECHLRCLRRGESHAGVLLIYQDNKQKKDMTPQ